MAISSMFLIIGGLLMSLAGGFAQLAGGRCITGAGVGIGIVAVTAYMSEVAPAAHRGFFGSLEELFVSLGIVGGYLANLALLEVEHNWRIMLCAGVFPAAVVLIILLLPMSMTGVPESPRFLYKKGRIVEARAVLVDLLDGNHEEAEIALEKWMAESIAEQKMATWLEAIPAFCTTHRYQFVAGAGSCVLNLFTGVPIATVGSTMIFVDAGIAKYDAMISTTLIGLTKVAVMVVAAVYLMDSWGRRPLLLLSLASCTGAGILGYVTAQMGMGSTWIVTAFVLFMLGFSLGVGPVPWVYMAEVFESRYRGKGCSLGIAGGRVVSCLQMFFFPILYPLVGVKGIFLFLVSVNTLGGLFVYAFCPETRGVLLEDVPRLFSVKNP